MSLLQTTHIHRTGKAHTPDRSLDPAQIEFGRWCTPNFFLLEYRNGVWQEPRVEPLHNFSLHPASLVFHYAQSIFEGLKAYRWANGSVALFRPEANARRMADSARRMDMPVVPEDLFLDAILNLVDLERNFVPSEPGSLYIRPTMIATEPCIGVRGASEFLFYVLTLPTGSYFKETAGGLGSIDVQVAESAARAAKGGTGAVKAAANYAVTLKGINDARKHGCGQVLYLDAAGRRLVEELGGMNVIFVRGDELLTPPLDNTILPGITRDSIVQLAGTLGLRLIETPLDIDDVVSQIESGSIAEALACGTAAVITNIRTLRFEDGGTVQVAGEPGPVGTKLYNALLDIQFGRRHDPFGWVRAVPVVE